MNSKRALVNLSGGIDSAYSLYLVLKEGYSVVVNHIHLINREGRHEVEKQAVENIMTYFKRRGYGAQMEYREMTFDYGTYPYIIKDVFIWSFATGMLLSWPRYQDVNTVVVSAHADSSFENVGRQRNGRIQMVESVAGRKPEWLFPIRHLTKAEVVQQTPPELLKLCWWCRKPTAGNKPCRTCHTCKAVNPHLPADLDWEFSSNRR